MVVVLGAWLSKKIDSPRLAAALVLVLIGVGIYGLANEELARRRAWGS